MKNLELFLKNLTTRPGVYQMLNQQGTVLYVGKAKNLKNRVSSYFKNRVDHVKTAYLVEQIADIHIIITDTENEALLLESNLIKELRPKYNILFKDDKSFPYLIFSNDDFPRLDYFRSHKTPKAHYFGPYPNAYAAKEAQHLIQKLFLIRNCSNGFFKNRSRPCLQYHIKRCSAPCVGYINEATYQKDVQHAKLFLQGKKKIIIDELTKRMDEAAEKLNYEKAALYRDQIRLLHQLETEQAISTGHKDYDVIGLLQVNQFAVLQLLQIRQGKIIFDQHFLSEQRIDATASEIIESFMEQYYLNTTKTMPAIFLISEMIQNQEWLTNAFSEQAHKKIKIRLAKNDYEKKLIAMAVANAEQTWQMRITQQSSIKQRFDQLAQALNLPAQHEWRIECFDISHTFGEATVASCVVFDENGPKSSDYRLFNIREVKAGDDFAAMRQVLERRYKRGFSIPAGIENPHNLDVSVKNTLNPKPDILLIDGGKGQISQAMDILKLYGIEDILVVGIAKGPSRKAGLETIFIGGSNQIVDLSDFPAALHLLQHIRDEAHRFAITRHRAKRNKNRRESVLENIEGIGAKKRQALLKYFGGLQELQAASLQQISQAPGIGSKLAKLIYQRFHD